MIRWIRGHIPETFLLTFIIVTVVIVALVITFGWTTGDGNWVSDPGNPLSPLNPANPASPLNR